MLFLLILITIISITTFIIFVGTDIVRRKLMLVTLGIN